MLDYVGQCLVPVAGQHLDGIGQEGGGRQHIQTGKTK